MLLTAEPFFQPLNMAMINPYSAKLALPPVTTGGGNGGTGGHSLVLCCLQEAEANTIAGGKRETFSREYLPPGQSIDSAMPVIPLSDQQTFNLIQHRRHKCKPLKLAIIPKVISF